MKKDITVRMVVLKNVQEWILILNLNSKPFFQGQCSTLKLSQPNPSDRGTYQPEIRASFCHLTDPGSYQDETNSTAPKTCPG